MIDPASVVFFCPSHLKAFKLHLFDRIAKSIESRGGKVVRGDFDKLAEMAKNYTPIVGCTPELRPLIDGWIGSGKRWIYWDRGAVRRVFATDLPPGKDGGYYRWCVDSYQMREIKDVSPDRWKSMKTDVWPWRSGKHIVVAEPSPTYEKFHNIQGWTKRTIAELKTLTSRPIIVRDKEMQRFGRKLHEDLKGAHCLVTHGSNAAVESVVMGCPVFVHPDSAAALVGLTDLNQIEHPIYPDRQPWLNSIAWAQYSEAEMTSGFLWKHLS